VQHGTEHDKKQLPFTTLLRSNAVCCDQLRIAQQTADHCQCSSINYIYLSTGLPFSRRDKIFLPPPPITLRWICHLKSMIWYMVWYHHS